MENVMNGPTQAYTENKKKAPYIVVAEDDKEMRTLLMIYLKKFGYTVKPCNNGKELLEEISTSLLSRKGKIDLIISDIKMPHYSALEILNGLKSIQGLPPVILITAFGNDELHKEAVEIGAKAVLDKPFNFDLLLFKVENILHSFDD
jgi:DNA-binding response OmpR family regulator